MARKHQKIEDERFLYWCFFFLRCDEKACGMERDGLPPMSIPFMQVDEFTRDMGSRSVFRNTIIQAIITLEPVQRVLGHKPG